QAGMYVFTKDEVKVSLKLTDDQQESIKEISDDLQKDLRDLRGAGGPGGRGGFTPPDAETQKKIEAVRKEAMDKAVKVLSESQKTAFKDALGTPADAAVFQAPGGAGGGFGDFIAAPGQLFSTQAKTTLKLTDDQKKEL